MTIVYRSISMSDLERAGYQVLIKVVDEKLYVERVFKDSKRLEIKEFHHGLFFLGLKINNLLILEPQCHHVKLNGQPTYNYRFTGQERNDEEWIKGGFASEEAILSSSRMGDMVDDAMRMQKGGDRSYKK